MIVSIEKLSLILDVLCDLVGAIDGLSLGEDVGLVGAIVGATDGAVGETVGDIVGAVGDAVGDPVSMHVIEVAGLATHEPLYCSQLFGNPSGQSAPLSIYA